MKKPIKPETFERRMAKLVERFGKDTEVFHHEADMLMVDLLRSLGYSGGADIFMAEDRWYA